MTKTEEKPEIASYSIGPFFVDVKRNTVTLNPGNYDLSKPITFGLLPETLITGATVTGYAGSSSEK